MERFEKKEGRLSACEFYLTHRDMANERADA